MPEGSIQKRSVLIICQLFYPELISTGQTVTELAEKLAALGVETGVICAPPTLLNTRSNVEKLIAHQGITVRRLWATRFPKLWLPGRVVNQVSFALSVLLHLLFRHGNSPVLVFTNPPFLIPICALVSLLRKLDYNCVIFDVYPETLISLGFIKSGGWLVRFMDGVNRLALRRASKVIVIGRCMRKLIEAKLPLMCRDRIEFIHVWADDENIKPLAKADNPLIDEWQLRGKFVVLYAGNMGRFHDMETIMDAAAKLSSSGAECAQIVFLIVGEGHKKAWCIRYAAEQNLANVIFKSHMEREMLPALLGTADLALVSLLPGQEGLSVPSKTLAAMSAGSPVIAVMAAGSEMACVVEEEGCGVRMENGDAEGLASIIKELSRDPDRLAVMRVNARKAIDNKYSLARAAERYLEILC